MARKPPFGPAMRPSVGKSSKPRASGSKSRGGGSFTYLGGATVTPLATVVTARARRAGAGFTLAGAGFTLIELLVTVVVLSILLGLGVPAFRSFMQNDQQWAQINTLVVGLNSARSEAIKNDRAAGVQICSSSDGTGCTATAWDQGWIVLGVDPANPRALK